jgi:hypothetical protein
MPRLFLLVLSGLLNFSSLYSQVTTASIYGTVLDSSGAAVPSASITATNTLTSASWSTTSDTAGEFTLTNLTVGSYAISVQAPGFKIARETGLDLSSGQRLRTSYTLEVGVTNETVTVTSETPLVNASTSEQRNVINTQQVVELPTARRDWTSLLRLDTGVAPAGEGGVTLNGLPPASFRLTVDGTDAEGDPELPSLSMYQNFNYIKAVSLEAIAEVSIAKGIASAEISNTMSGNVNLITRGGTNAFHGSLFENNQVENLAARNQFLTTKAPIVLNQFGGSIGGPVVPNKLFFFFVYEGYRESAFRPISGNVPTEAFRQEAIAAVPAYKPYFDLYPLPNSPVAPGAITGFYQGAASNVSRDNHIVGRGDYQITESTSLSARYTRSRPFRVTPRVTSNERAFTGVTEVGTMSFTHARTTMTSETRFGYNQNDVTREDAIYGFGVPGITCCLGFADAGETLFKGGKTLSFEEVISLNRGRHAMKVGGIFLHRKAGRSNIETPEIQYPNVADFLANRPSVAQVTWGVNPFSITNWQLGFFVQDDFRISRNFILNIGLRYDYMAVPNERDDRFFNRGGPFGFGPLQPPDSPYKADFLNFSPRVGFAWTLDSAGRTVIRSGFGIFSNPHTLFGGPVELVRNAIDEPNRYIFSRADIDRLGLRYPITNENTLQYVRDPNAPWSNTSINTDFPNPYSMQWMLSVQRQFARSVVFESSYVGTRGVKLNLVRDFNQVDRLTGARPVAGFAQIRYYDTSESSHYHAWQNQLRKRLSHDLIVNAFYTWSSNISYNDGDLLLPSTRPQDNNNLRAERGPTPYDIRHRFAVDFLYELPFQRWASGGTASRLLLGGWQFSGIYTFNTGAPFTIVQGSSIPGSRPDYIGGEPILDNYKDTLVYLNPAAFARVPVIQASGATARLGNLGRNALRSPGGWNVDLALSKNLAFTETLRLQLRADMFNAFNHTVLGGVSSGGTASILAGNFGRLTSATARVVQLNARFSF